MPWKLFMLRWKGIWALPIKNQNGYCDEPDTGYPLNVQREKGKKMRSKKWTAIFMIFILPVLTNSVFQAAPARREAVRAYRKLLAQPYISLLPEDTVLATDYYYEDYDEDEYYEDEYDEDEYYEEDEFVYDETEDDWEEQLTDFYYQPTIMRKAMFTLACLDEDDIPELIVLDTGTEGNPSCQGMAIYTWKDSRLQKVAEKAGGYGDYAFSWNPIIVGYYRETGVLVLRETAEGAKLNDYYQIKNGKLQLLLREEFWEGYYDYFTYYTEDDVFGISEEAYQNILEVFKGGDGLTRLETWENTQENRAKYLN